MLRTKQPGSTTEAVDEHTTNMFEFNLYSEKPNTIGQKVSAPLGVLNHKYTSGVTNATWHTENTYIAFSSLYGEIHCDTQRPGSEKNQALSRHNWAIILNKQIWILKTVWSNNVYGLSGIDK